MKIDMAWLNLVATKIQGLVSARPASGVDPLAEFVNNALLLDDKPMIMDRLAFLMINLAKHIEEHYNNSDDVQNTCQRAALLAYIYMQQLAAKNIDIKLEHLDRLLTVTFIMAEKVLIDDFDRHYIPTQFMTVKHFRKCELALLDIFDFQIQPSQEIIDKAARELELEFELSDLGEATKADFQIEDNVNRKTASRALTQEMESILELITARDDVLMKISQHADEAEFLQRYEQLIKQEEDYRDLQKTFSVMIGKEEYQIIMDGGFGSVISADKFLDEIAGDAPHMEEIRDLVRSYGDKVSVDDMRMVCSRISTKEHSNRRLQQLLLRSVPDLEVAVRDLKTKIYKLRAEIKADLSASMIMMALLRGNAREIVSEQGVVEVVDKDWLWRKYDELKAMRDRYDEDEDSHRFTV